LLLKIPASSIKRSREAVIAKSLLKLEVVASMVSDGVSFSTTGGTAEGKTISSIVKSYWFKIKILIAEFG
jgi:hypothetical protein